MKRSLKNASLSILFFFFAAISSAALDASFSGTLKTEAAVALPAVNCNSSEDRRGDFIEGTISFNGVLDIIHNESSLKADATLSFDALNAVQNAKDFTSGIQNFSFSLNEAWYDYNGSWWAIRIGRQIQGWGKADGLEVCDILCPKDLTTLLSDDYASSRLGINAARASFNWNWGTADIYWIPFFTPSALPLKDGNPLKEILFPKSAALGSTSVPINEITDSSIKTPALKIQNGEYALKFSAYSSAADFSFYGFYGWEREPLISYSANIDAEGIESIGISGEYERVGMIGADAAVPVKETVLRLEAAFFPMRHFAASAKEQIQNSERSVKRNELRALVGIDWMPSTWTITAQYYCAIIFGSLAKTEKDAFTHEATLSVSKSFLNETLSLELNGILDLNYFSSAVKFRAEYSLSDQISVNAGINCFFPGKDGGLYDRYKTLSCISLGGKFSF